MKNAVAADTESVKKKRDQRVDSYGRNYCREDEGLVARVRGEMISDGEIEFSEDEGDTSTRSCHVLTILGLF